MSSSRLEGRITNGLTPGADMPCGAGYLQDYVANNLLHYADVYGQTRVNWVGCTSSFAKNSGYLSHVIAGESIITPDQPHLIASWGPFPIAIASDGQSYYVRVRIAGASSAGNAVKFYATLAPPGVRAADETARLQDNVYMTTTTTSTSGAWLTGASRGSQAYTTMVRLTGAQVALWTVQSNTSISLGGSPTRVRQCLVALSVYGSTANPGSRPRLYGVHASEWCGV